ncbi:MAG: hypothetical protein ACD_36C00092G0003 [uncultured bacterium]|uniref:Uncharacterized protein n=1 Tax=Candidatus Gottesmanbacteria bacterium RIFCSPLOWO2_01_FULL_43_11b TaxID=1798392 RepID=A0A1F6AHI3_9BACT|nr:MAG: hypothetical protein ACD_36C00092G0003 [uncultured bacterium]OGG24200.1 MAG: hypothetical protein A3A79_03360 [Candidatus Gottesmanbacteria bacterium RIFCSPLOWO2_01_FULL_43_11b]
MTQLSQSQKYIQQFKVATEKPQVKAYSATIFSFLAASLFGLYAILPTVRTILFLRREIADKTTVNKQMEDKISALIESQASYEAAGERLDLVFAAIPQTAQPVELALSLRNLAASTVASASSIQISSVPLTGEEATASASPQKNSSPYPLTVVVNDSYGNLKTFIDGILSLQRILTIDSINFTPSSEIAESTLPGSIGLQLVLQLTTYYQN